MSKANESRRGIEALRERISALSAAVLRINASLDVDTVLRETAEAARSLTGARYAVITAVDGDGQPEDYVISGLSPEEIRQLEEWPDRLRVFEALRDLPSPRRLTDLPAYVAGLGFSTEALFMRTFQGAPMRHRGVQVGNFFLGGKETGPEFTDEDEEVLALFAAQAAAAIVNARTHRAERQTRADLEALIEISPVGVVVFDARSGRPVSFNREARRIVEGLLTPGGSTEELLDTMTFRRADGREVSLSEFPMAELLSIGETLRGEEVEFSVQDGRSVRTLINATPIHSADDEVASMVVTMQDLAPLEELERLRTEFLSLVSHELRAPLAAIKGSADTLLEEGADLDPAEMREFHRIIHEQTAHMRGLIGDLLDAGRIEAGNLSVSPEPSEVAALVDRARNTFLSGGGRHVVVIDLPPNLPRVMADRRRIVQVLNNLLANAARHSPEATPIRVTAVREGTHVTVSVSDEGRGIAPEQLPHLFLKHAGPAAERPLSDTGLGLVICKGLVEAHGGRIRAESAGAGQGSRFTFTLPAVEDARQSEHADAAALATDTPRDAGEPTRVLVVDDDPHILRFVRDALTKAGYVALVTGEHEDLARIIRTETPSLVLLDVLLPGTDGIALLENVPELADLPVVFISGYGRDENIARALEAGAADYIVKPFSATELAARVGAALRRVARPEPFALGGLAIHYEARRVTVAGREVELTATEYELLRVLSLNAGRVVTYHTLQRRVWSGNAGGIDLVRNFVKKLRAKLGEDAENPTWIFNVRGVGYRMPHPKEV